MVLVLCAHKSVWNGGPAVFVPRGFGKPDTSTLIGGNSYGRHLSPVATSLLANAPQLVVSYIYIAYNGLLTSMLTTAEWVAYAARPKNLRVTWPKGQQRTRNYLQLPYLYGIPLLIASTLLHWLISQSLYLVRVTGYESDGTESYGNSVSAAGYSPFAIVFAISMGAAMLVAALLIGLLRAYPTNAPLAACCSASLAASCQPQEPMTEDDVTQKKLQWGVVDEGAVANGGVGHACFSFNDVSPLVEGRRYA